MKRIEWGHVVTPHVVVRTPLLSIDVLRVWGGDQPRDEAALRRDLRVLLDDPVIREAIFISSPDLDANLGAWLGDPGNPEHRGVERTVIRYLSRMAGRATPFGLMSGLGTGAVGPTSNLVLGARDAGKRHIRIDNDYLASTCSALANDPSIRAGLRWFPNSSLYTSGGRLRYAEARSTVSRSYHLVVVEPTDYLLAVLQRATAGASIEELVATLMEDPDIGTDDAIGFVDQLIETQLLVPELEPQVTGREPLGPVLETLRPIEAAMPMVASLTALAEGFSAIEASRLGAPLDHYHTLAALAAPLPIRAPLGRLFQLDFHRPSPELVIGKPVIDEVTRALAVLHRCGGIQDDDSWSRFRDKFSERYATREVPLFEVLDEEIGIGFMQPAPPTAPLLEIVMPARAETRRVAWGRREVTLLRMVQQATKDRAIEIELSAADEGALSAKSPNALFDVLAVVVSIGAASPEALAAGDFHARIVGTDSPGARMLGRFCYGDPAIDAIVRDLMTREEARRADQIFAEVVHLPEGRIGNVLLRPQLRGHEIPFLGRSGAPRDRQIQITDLMVSIVDNRVVLRSKTLGKQVVPRLTNAHNYTRFSLGIYRFLSAIASQDGSMTGWTWGPLADAAFLPRIRSGKTTLFRARWLLAPRDLHPLRAAGKGKVDGFAAVQQLRARHDLPRWITLAENDNELPVDLDNRLAVDSFINLVKTKQHAEIYELYPTPEQLAVRGPDGAYHHELQLFYVREQPIVPAAAPPPSAPVVERRNFAIGSNWLYLKYYSGYSMTDELLRTIAPVIRGALGDQLAGRWFFLRYADPEWHLRLRFAGRDPKALMELLLRLAQAVAPLERAGVISKTQLDTYDREVERYGGFAGIDLAERVFAADSDAALSIIEAYPGDSGTQAMWPLAMLGMDTLIDDFGIDFEAKRRLLARMRDSFGSEIGIDTDFKKRLGEKFRMHRPEIEAVFAAHATNDFSSEPFGPGLAALAQRRGVLRALAPELVALRDARELAVPIPALVQSYIHMHANRMLAASARTQELVIYDLLRRHHDGTVGRARQAAK